MQNPSSRQPLTRMLGGVVDQGLWALSNISLVVVTARRSGLKDVGIMGVVVLLYVLVLGLVRAVTGLSLIVRFSAVDPATRRQAGGAAASSAGLLGLVGTVLLASVGIIAGGRMEGPMIAVAIQFPLLMVQDVVRYMYLSERRPWRAAVTDLIWLIASIVAYPILIVWGFGAPGIAFAWAFGGSVSALVELVILRPPLVANVRFAVHHWDLNRHQLVEAALQYGSIVFGISLLGFVADLKAIGQVNMGISLLGPLRTMLLGVALAAVPEAVHTARRGSRVLRRHILWVSLSLASLAALCGLAIQLIPHQLGTAVLSHNWRPAQQIALPLSLGFVGLAFSFGPLVGLRSLERAALIVRCSFVQVFASTIGFVVGAVVGGALGAAGGQSIGLILSTFVWWRTWRAVAQFEAVANVGAAEVAATDDFAIDALAIIDELVPLPVTDLEPDGA